MIAARKGQGLFRTNVRRIERGCRLTGIIKPWRSCINTNERLDGNDGLLLMPNVDLLFDRGLISFQDNARVLFSQRLNSGDIERLGLAVYVSSDAGSFVAEQRVYLEYDRSNVFLG